MYLSTVCMLMSKSWWLRRFIANLAQSFAHSRNKLGIQHVYDIFVCDILRHSIQGGIFIWRCVVGICPLVWTVLEPKSSNGPFVLKMTAIVCVQCGIIPLEWTFLLFILSRKEFFLGGLQKRKNPCYSCHQFYAFLLFMSNFYFFLFVHMF